VNLCNILQWNAHGVSPSKQDLIFLINRYKPSAIAIQETFLSNDCMINLPGYSSYFKQGHFNQRYHGGVALFVHNSCPHEPVTINSRYQAVAARIKFEGIATVTVASIYIPGREPLHMVDLKALTRQCTQPCVLLGDFNAHSTQWGNNQTNLRGRIIETWTTEEGINITNTGLPTHVSGTAIDLTLLSPTLSPGTTWTTHPSLLSSDHYPIVVTLRGRERTAGDPPVRRNFRGADWKQYQKDTTWRELPQDLAGYTNEEITYQMYMKFTTAGDNSIPKYKKVKYYPKPYWSKECTDRWHDRERRYRRYKNSGSIQDKIEWKRSSAVATNCFRLAKRNNFRQICSTLTQDTDMIVIWNHVNKIKGRTPYRITMLHEDGRSFESLSDIANQLAHTFSKISGSENYTQDFQAIRQTEEQQHQDFQSRNLESYNRLFSIQDFQTVLSNVKDSASGPDDINYQMIKNLPALAQEYVLRIFNKFWTESYFPAEWRKATVIPIPKPGKDHTKSVNYRPIALTSCLSKLLEKLINQRLIEYLENNKLFSRVQCGFRKQKSTIDHLVRLETTKHVVSVFFDIEKAYDTAWRYGIMRDLHTYGLRGRLPLYVQQFLMNRMFKVKVDKTLSETKQQCAGVPQGCVLSVTLFAIKINSLTAVIPPHIHSSLYVDDLQISFADHSPLVVTTTLQNCIDDIQHWATYNGFKFSNEKTKCVHFYKGGEPILNLLPLKLNETPIPYVETMKFLGLIWDRKLNFAVHINQLKSKCMRAMNLLRTVSSQDWGADQHTLMILYKTLIRSKLDYGCIVNNSANNILLSSLDTVANEAMRISTGAFKSSPIECLHIITNEPPLELRRQEITLRYYYRMKSLIQNPAYESVHSWNVHLFFRSRPLCTPPLTMRAQGYVDHYQLPKRPVLTYQTPTIFTWELKVADTDMSLSIYKKDTVPNQVYRQVFSSLLEETYQEYCLFFTDGSKTEDGVGAAVVSGDLSRSESLPKVASIYSAELHAINMALSIIEDHNHDKFLICSDSSSAINQLKNHLSPNHMINRIQKRIHNLLSDDKVIKFCWIPGHAGILGNEQADEGAKNATKRPPALVSVPYTDWTQHIRDGVRAEWTDRWNLCNRDLRKIKPTPGPWKKIRKLTRKEEVVLNRLRIGHTFLTHNHLFNDEVQAPLPQCELCQNAAMTIKHILTACPAIHQQRVKFLSQCVKNN
jgi:ribonuclease HI